MLQLSAPLVVIQRNPHSGTRRRNHCLHELVRELKARGFRPRMFSSRPRMDAFLAKPANRENIHVLVAAGGDGTVDDVINRHPGLTLAILPLGTENLLGRYLKYPLSGKTLAEWIAAGNTRRLDIATIGGRGFCTLASAGFDASIVQYVHTHRRGHARRWNYFDAFLRHLVSYRFPKMTLQWATGDSTQSAECTQVFIVNVPRYAMGLPVARHARDDDGVLELRLLNVTNIFSLLFALAKLFLGMDVGRQETADRLTLTNPGGPPIAIEVGGDPHGSLPVEFAIQPLALKVVTPPG